jgi:O-antigen ligase
MDPARRLSPPVRRPAVAAKAQGLAAFQHPSIVGQPNVGQPARQGGSRLPFYFASLLLFVHFGRLFDTFLKGYKIPAIICGACIVVSFLAGGLKELRSRVGIAFLFMVAWMCVSAPLSYWPGGTAAYVLWFAEFFLPLMTLVAVASKTPTDIVKLCGVLAFSCAFHLILNSSNQYGRAALNGTFGNPDDVALLAGFTIPFLILIASRLKNPAFRFGLLIAGIGYLLLTIGRTATRAAIPALIAMAAVYFFRSSGGRKLGIVACSVVVAVVGVFALPHAAVERLSTILDAVAGPSSVSASSAGMNEAEASSFERHELMQDAIKTAITHPVAGVGAGLFTQYRWDHMLRANGEHKPYLPAHNTYLEIASECGIPGVIFYVIFLVSTYTTIRDTRKLAAFRATPQAELLTSIALSAEAALVYFAVCAMFMTCDKHPHQFALAGFAMAMIRMARALPVEAPAAAPSTRLPKNAPAPYAGRRSWPVAAY